MKLPKTLRFARAQTGSRADPYNFNKGFDSPKQWGLSDALRGSGRLTGDHTASVDAIEQAARNSPRRRG